jgi:hypothetical protein
MNHPRGDQSCHPDLSLGIKNILYEPLVVGRRIALGKVIVVVSTPSAVVVHTVEARTLRISHKEVCR